MIAAGDAALASAKGKPKAFEYLGARASLQAAGVEGAAPLVCFFMGAGCWPRVKLSTQGASASQRFLESLYSPTSELRGGLRGGGGVHL